MPSAATRARFWRGHTVVEGEGAADDYLAVGLKGEGLHRAPVTGVHRSQVPAGSVAGGTEARV